MNVCAFHIICFAYKLCTNKFDNFSDFLENTNNILYERD